MDCPFSLFPRNAAELEHVCETSGRVGPAAEAEQIDAVSRLPHADDRHIAVDDFRRDSEPEHLLNGLLETVPAVVVPRRRRSDARNVERELLLGVDDRVRTRPRRPVQLVDVGAALVRQEAALVSRTVGEDQDVLRHAGLLQMMTGSSDASAMTMPVASVKIAATSLAFCRYAS